MRYVDTIDGYGELKGGLIKIKQLINQKKKEN